MKNHVKSCRNAHKLTQTEFAEKIQVSRQTVHAIESGKFIPSTVLALKIARLFSLPVETVFELEPGD